MNFEITTSPDSERWNNFVDCNNYSNIFQKYEMVDVYNNTRNMGGLRFAVSNKEGKILACMAVKTESRKFLKSLTSIAIIENAPLYEDSEQGRDAAKFLIEYYNQYIKRKILYTTVKIEKNAFLADLYKLYGYSQSTSLNFEINLNRTADEVFKSIHKSRRQNIRGATKKGVIVVEAEKASIQEWYSLLKENYDRLKVPLPDISYFNAAFNLMPNNIKLFFAKYQNTFIAGRIVLVYKQKLLDWYAASTLKYVSMSPNEALVWSILEWGCKEDYKVFDFGGAGVPGKEYGVREFKRSFGGELISFDTFTKVHMPALLWFMKKGYKVYNKFKMSSMRVKQSTNK